MATASISALLKFKVTGSCVALAGALRALVLALVFLLGLGACALTVPAVNAKGRQMLRLIKHCISGLLCSKCLEVCVRKTMMFNPMRASCVRLGAVR